VTPRQQRTAIDLLWAAAGALQDEYDANGADDVAAHPTLVGHARTLAKLRRFLATAKPAKPAPRVPRRVLNGIISATSAVLSGEQTGDGGDCEGDGSIIAAADAWAREQRDGGDK
jgi:hypothetical protein